MFDDPTYRVSGCFVVLIGTFLAVNFAPLLLFFPATLVASSILLVKAASVFVHTKEVQRWSLTVSSAEGTFESAYQFVFMFFIWFNGGQREILSMSTSLVLIAKSRVEMHLSAETDPNEAKTAKEKAFLLAFFVPSFLITTFFRLSSLAIVFAHIPSIPDPILSLYLYVCYYFASTVALYMVINICALGCQPISNMSVLERGHAVTGKPFKVRPTKTFTLIQQDQYHQSLYGWDLIGQQGQKYR